jgi:transposase-like protein
MSPIWRWVQRYAPGLSQRIRREMRHPNRSWRMDETYVEVAGNWAYLYRAVDSAGETIRVRADKTKLLAIHGVSGLYSGWNGRTLSGGNEVRYLT